MIISDFLSKALKGQPAQSDFLPKVCQHVTNNIVHYKSGHVGFTIRMQGLPLMVWTTSTFYPVCVTAPIVGRDG
ncbi:hypothetical protein [Paralysiella testudinis]|uniref:hypothetical protein n=1 Tax=Paralysiella testudinis TaxID=2809020 RepID=UPI001E28E1D6|nr:hypothetical protein [Paralysiella testudinis]